MSKHKHISTSECLNGTVFEDTQQMLDTTYKYIIPSVERVDSKLAEDITALADRLKTVSGLLEIRQSMDAKQIMECQKLAVESSKKQKEAAEEILKRN